MESLLPDCCCCADRTCESKSPHMPPLAVDDAVHGVTEGVTDDAELAVGTDTDLRSDVEVASGAAAKWTSRISDRSRFLQLLHDLCHEMPGA